MPSLSLRVALFAIRMMGFKKTFSQIPVNYAKLRKGDVRSAPKRLHKKFDCAAFQVKETKVTTLAPKGTANTGLHLLYVHGGAFVSGPSQIHWDTLARIATETQCTAWMVDYPKAPEAGIEQINENIDAVYQKAVQSIPPDAKIALAGDSVGGTLILTLVQRLVAAGDTLPHKLIGITPVFDASMTNPKIEAIDPNDPMLSQKGILSAKTMCAQGSDLKGPAISPLYGSFDGFPPTLLFIGGRDIMYPDGKLVVPKLKAAQVKLEVVDAPEMPHIWPLLPVAQEARAALDHIIASLKKL